MLRDRAIAILEAVMDSAQVQLVQDRLRDADQPVMLAPRDPDKPDEFYKDFERTMKELIRAHLPA